MIVTTYLDYYDAIKEMLELSEIDDDEQQEIIQLVADYLGSKFHDIKQHNELVDRFNQLAVVKDWPFRMYKVLLECVFYTSAWVTEAYEKDIREALYLVNDLVQQRDDWYITAASPRELSTFVNWAWLNEYILKYLGYNFDDGEKGDDESVEV